jgi:indolepyruvate ferredoxin oxidoreductase
VIPIAQHFSRNLDELVERREKFLAGYQNESYARKYRALVELVKGVEKEKAGSSQLAEAVARYYAKLLAYKDEYEVARLHSDGAMRRKVDGMFEGDYKVVYHLAPPLLARVDPLTGEPKKIRFGSWIGGVFSVLTRLKFLRGTPFDPFGYTAERRTERALIREYEDMVARLLVELSPQNLPTAIQLASLPEDIRGYGHIKLKNVEAARRKRDELLAGFNQQKKQKAAA